MINARGYTFYFFSYLAVNCFLHSIGTVGSMNYQRPKRKRSTKRRTVQFSGWGRPELKAELKRIAESEGISFSEAVIAACEELVRAKLKRRREILELPILEAFFEKQLNHALNYLSEFIGRCVYEIGQTRWLYVNTQYQELNNKIAQEPDVEKKKQLREKFYKLLDESQKETVKATKGWNANVKDVVEAIKQYVKERMKEGENI